MEVLAIDGPAGSGKSTLAQALAARLGMSYLDTGATFRMIAWSALRSNVNLDDEAAIVKIAETRNIVFDTGKCAVDDFDVTQAIRVEAVSAAASRIAVHPKLREKLLHWQRAWVIQHGDSVVEGRDTTTVVFPDASLKIYLEADASVRAARRSEATAGSTAARDERDSKRLAAPLLKAPGSVVIDTSKLTPSQVEDRAIRAWGQRQRHNIQVGLRAYGN